MGGRLRCPACGDRVPEPVPGRPVVCPGCGARLAPKQRAGPAREADPAGGPRKRPRPRQRTSQGLPVLVWVIPAAAVGVLGVAAVGALLLWLAWARLRPVPVAAGGREYAADAGEVADAGEPAEPPAVTFLAVPWAVPPGGAAAGPPVADVLDLGTLGLPQPVYLFPGSRDRYLTPVPRIDRANPRGRFTLGLAFGRFDPATGKAVGKPDLVLGAEFMADNAPGKADVAADGTLAAMAVNGKTADTAGAISVFAPGDKEPRRLPPATAYAKWFSWSAADRLLVLKDGKLAAWDTAAGKPAFEVGEKLGEPATLSPGRNWVVACVDGQYLEVRDAATGAVRGRLGGEGDWKFLDVSPDGKRLAAVRYRPLAPGTPVNHPYDAELHVWDLATGERTARFKDTLPGRVSWAGPNHLLHAGRVFDVETGLAVVTLNMPSAPPVIVPVASPDGRLWWSGRNGQAFAAAAPTTPAAGQLAFNKGAPIRLEVSLADARRNERIRAALTRELAATGHPVGESPWLLNVTAQEYDVGRTLVVVGQDRVVKEPGVRGDMKLIAPDRTAVATIPIGGEFPERRSKYFVRERRDPTQFGEFILEYDFRGTDPRQAMLAEAWAGFMRFPADVRRLPAVWEVGGKFQALPLPVTLPLPAGVRPQ